MFLEFNEKPMVGLKVPEFLTLGYKLEEGSPISVKVERDGKELTLEGEVRNNYSDGFGYEFTDTSKVELKNQWLNQ